MKSLSLTIFVKEQQIRFCLPGIFQVVAGLNKLFRNGCFQSLLISECASEQLGRKSCTVPLLPHVKEMTLITSQVAESHNPLTQDCKNKLNSPCSLLSYYNDVTNNIINLPQHSIKVQLYHPLSVHLIVMVRFSSSSPLTLRVFTL